MPIRRSGGLRGWSLEAGLWDCARCARPLVKVESTDVAQEFGSLGAGKPITDLRDCNRDGAVPTADAAVVFANLGDITGLNVGGGRSFAPAASADHGSSSAVGGSGTQTIPTSVAAKSSNLGSSSSRQIVSRSEHCEAAVIAGPARFSANAHAAAHDLSLDNDLLDYLLEDVSSLVTLGKGKKTR